MQIKKVAIVGGTHGNELTGIYLLRKWMKNLSVLERKNLCPKLLLANQRAIRQGRRYLDHDLNRCFSTELLSNPRKNSSEMERALTINKELGPKGNPEAYDLVLDLHNTTAAMGITFIVSRLDAFTRFACRYLIEFDDRVHIYFMPEEPETAPYLPTIGKRDFCIEVGPQAHGILRADLFLATEKVVHKLLDLVEEWNSWKSDEITETTNSGIPVYEHWKNLDFPRDEDGHPTAMIHPALQHRDYHLLKPGAPLFLDLHGKIIPFESDQPAWPVFLNEQAYYEKGVAVSLTRRREDLL